MHRINVFSVGNGILANLTGPTLLLTNENGGYSSFVATMEAARGFFRRLIDAGETTADEAARVEGQIREEMAMPNNLAELRQRCNQLLLQHSSAYGFEMCTDADCDGTKAEIPHGWIMYNGQKASNTVHDFQSLYAACVRAVNSLENPMIANDALAVLQQSTGIALTYEEVDQAVATKLGGTTPMMVMATIHFNLG